MNNETDLDIHNSDIYLFTNWGPIGFILFMPLFTYLMSVSKLRATINFTAILLILAGVLRIIPHQTFTNIPRKWLFHAAQFFNGIAGCLPVSAPAHLSALWFSEEQRGFSTAIIFSSSWLGTCLSFVIGPLLVKDLHTLNVYLYIQLAMAMFSAIGMLAYFPEKPPTPPSRSAAFQEHGGSDNLQKFTNGLKMLTSGECTQFWVLLVTTCTVGGIFSTWQANCSMVFGQWITEFQAAELGFSTVCAGSLATFLFGSIIHKLKGGLRPILIIVMLVFTICAGLCILLSHGYFTSKHAETIIIWASSLLFGIVLIGSTPIVFEQLADCAFPADENLAGSIAAYMNNVMGLFCGQMPIMFNGDPNVMTYCLFAACAISTVTLWTSYKEQNRREEIGNSVENTVNGVNGVNGVNTDANNNFMSNPGLDDTLLDDDAATHSVLSSISFSSRTTDEDDGRY